MIFASVLKPLKWILGMLLVALSGFALILHKMSGSKTLADAAIGAIEAAHKPKIDALNQKMDDLSKQQVVDQVAMDKAQHAVDQRKADLQMVYGHTGLSDNEVMNRLAKMSV